MKFHKKNILLPDSGKEHTFNCHDYSTIIDIEVYKGGYDSYYLNIFYTTPGDVDYSENKTVTILCINEIKFVDSQRDKLASPNPWENKIDDPIVVDDKFKFLKSVSVKYGNLSSRYLFFIHEELSKAENRDVKIDSIGI